MYCTSGKATKHASISRPQTTAVSPVRAPMPIPTALSTKVTTLVVPSNDAPVVPTPSTSSARVRRYQAAEPLQRQAFVFQDAADAAGDQHQEDADAEGQRDLERIRDAVDDLLAHAGDGEQDHQDARPEHHAQRLLPDEAEPADG